MVRIIASLSVMLLLAGCATHSSGIDASRSAKYFATPEEAVEVTTKLLKAQDWKELTRYYDLAGTAIPGTDLESGKFFLRTERPANAHPGLDWRIKEPFTPGFKFERALAPNKTGVLRVDVSISIDQGGGMVQRATDSFMLQSSEHGYQLVPKPQASERELTAEDEIRRSYTPKLGADTIAEYRPSIRERYINIPSVELEALVPLLKEMEHQKHKLQIMPISPREPQLIAYAGVEDSNPLDEQLLVSEIGERIRMIVGSNEPKNVDEVLTAAGWTTMEVKYSFYEVKHVDVMGTGRVFYCEKPVAVSFMLPKKDTGH